MKSPSIPIRPASRTTVDSGTAVGDSRIGVSELAWHFDLPADSAGERARDFRLGAALDGAGLLLRQVRVMPIL